MLRREEVKHAAGKSFGAIARKPDKLPSRNAFTTTSIQSEIQSLSYTRNPGYPPTRRQNLFTKLLNLSSQLLSPKWSTPKPMSCSRCASKRPSPTPALSSRYAYQRIVMFRPRNSLTAHAQKINEHCFERCVPTPGSSLSSGEQTCFNNCMEKYMGAWNATSRQYLSHVQKGM